MKKILLVDDEFDLREDIAEDLRDSGYEIIEAVNGVNALKLLDQRAPDLVLCDISMPNMNGTEFLKIVRNSGRDHSDIPFLFLTALSGAKDMVDHLDLGADDYLVKPIDLDVLKAKINTVLRQRGNYDKRIEAVEKTDTITGLPNKEWFRSRLSLIDDNNSNNSKFAILKLHLGGCHVSREAWGQNGENLFMVSIEKVVRETIRNHTLEAELSAYGVGEFSILLHNVISPAISENFARILIDALQAPISIMGRKISPMPYIGISIWPDHSSDIQTVSRYAYLAMSDAIHRGTGQAYQFFTPRLDTHIHEEINLNEHLLSGLEKEEFYLHYQPILDLSSNTIVGAEALIRWKNDLIGPLSTEFFIPLMEKSGQIIKIGHWVSNTALSFLANTQRQLNRNLRMAINCSAKELNDTNILAILEGIIDQHGITPSSIELELTERLAVNANATCKAILENLSEMGIRLSIDDFGTGYSGLSALRKAPFHSVKIDKSFIQGSVVSRKDAALCRTIINMAHDLNMEVVAEGVETQEQFDFITDCGCNLAQGYYFSKPLPQDDFLNYLKNPPTFVVFSRNELAV